jgi:L-asparaginase type II
MLRAMSNPKKIILVGTGGTIAGVVHDPGKPYLYADSQLGIEEVAQRLPLPASVKVEAIQLWKLGSEDFTEASWRGLYLHLKQQLRRPDVAGIVLTQGTDTIEETAFFLGKVLAPGKPVVVTGAMRPSGALSSDAPLNIYQSLALAAHPSAHGRGCLVLMNERIYAPCEAVKSHTFAADSFQSPEGGPLGIMLGDTPHWTRSAVAAATLELPRTFGETPLPRVDLVWAYAGIQPEMIQAAVASGAGGIVYAGTGNGSVASQVRAALLQAGQRGCVVVRASRAAAGMVVRNASEDDEQLHTVAAWRYPAVKARILLQLGLALKMQRPALQALFQA